MKSVTFNMYVCGMNESTFTNKIMIYAPFATYEKTFYGEELPSKNVSDIIRIVEENAATFIEEHGVRLNLEHIYIQTDDTLIGLQNDKKLEEIFSYFSTENIHFAHFTIVGGSSICCRGYKFVVHSDEKIHRDTPHVHVYKDGKNTRYSLDTLKRFPEDDISREFIRDEKKIILPFLKENHEELMEFWRHNVNGYICLAEDVDGNQYYPES